MVGDTDARMVALRRRSSWPAWLNPTSVLATLGVLGPATFVCLYAYVVGYLDELGLTPEELDVGQTSLLVRAAGVALVLAMIGALILPFAAGAVAMVLWLVSFLLRDVLGGFIAVVAEAFGAQENPVSTWWRADHRPWAASGIGRLRRRTWFIAVGCTAMIVAVGVVGPGSDGVSISVLVMATVFAMALVIPLVLWRHAAAAVATGLVVLGIAVLGALQAGGDAAASAAPQAEPNRFAQLLGVAPRQVCVLWSGGASPSWLPADAVVQIGQTGSGILLTDGVQVFTVSPDLVDAVVTSQRGADDTPC